MNRIIIDIEEYIKTHSVAAEGVCIFREWNDFLDVVYNNGESVHMIVWYEYCRIKEQRIGMGGYRDNEDPGYMWAETQIFETDLESKSCDEIKKYISETRNRYAQYDLYPEFYL